MRKQKGCMGFVAVVVDDYDRAIEYYTGKLGFTLIEDTPQPGKRWGPCQLWPAGSASEQYTELSDLSVAVAALRSPPD